MRLTDWAANPLSGPPPIPFATDIVNATNCSYRIGAIPAASLAEDLTASGLTYSPGRSNGYRLHGERIDSYAVGDVIADTFKDAAALLSYFVATDPTMVAIADDEDRLVRLPYRDRDEALDATRTAIRRRIQAAEAPLPFTRATLDLARASLAETARSVRGILYVRREAIRRFRTVLPQPVRTRTDGPATISLFLSTIPAGTLLVRPALHEAALAAGLGVGPRKLYEAANAAGWALTRRNGLHYYRAP